LFFLLSPEKSGQVDTKERTKEKIKDGMIAPRVRPANASLCVAGLIQASF
jgi:hypothetical protein